MESRSGELSTSCLLNYYDQARGISLHQSRTGNRTLLFKRTRSRLWSSNAQLSLEPYSHPGQVCNGVASWVSQQGDDSSQIASEWETTAQRRTKPMYVTCRNSVCGILLWICRIVPQVVLSSLAHMHNHAVCCTKNVAHPMAYLHSHKGCRV